IVSATLLRPEDAMGRVITISATYGAGGTIVAPRLAERLGLPFADRLIPARGGEDAPGEELSEQEREESRRRGFLDRLARLTGGHAADPAPSHLVLDSTGVPLAACVTLIELAATSFWESS